LKKVLIFGLATIALVLSYIGGVKLLETNDSNNPLFEIGKNDKNALSEEKYYERNIELHKCIDISKEAIMQLRQLVSDNISSITEKNCSGLLADIDKDNVYDKSILGMGITSNDTSVQIHYNFCSILYSNQEPIIITLTTDKLLEEFVVEKEFGDRFVPTFNVKQSKNLKKPGEFIVEESVGLINLEDFLVQ
jgi:hypothetical protein